MSRDRLYCSIAKTLRLASMHPPPAAAPPHPPFDVPQCSGGGHSELGEASRGRINLPIPTGWLFNGCRGFTLSEKVFRRGVTVESF